MKCGDSELPLDTFIIADEAGDRPAQAVFQVDELALPSRSTIGAVLASNPSLDGNVSLVNPHSNLIIK